MLASKPGASVDVVVGGKLVEVLDVLEVVDGSGFTVVGREVVVGSATLVHPASRRRPRVRIRLDVAATDNEP